MAQREEKEAGEKTANPGWYEQAGSLRYFDGDRWTADRAPLPPLASKELTSKDISWAVFKALIAAWFVILLGAGLVPDYIFFPVKFVVEEMPDF